MKPTITHRQLQYLVAVCDTGHFGKAAKNCNVSQPTLSSQIQLLEDRLGTRLIERAPDGARPTPQGEEVIAKSREVIALLNEIGSITRAAEANLGGVIRLGILPSFGPYFLPTLLARLKPTYPDMEISIREKPQDQLNREVQEGRLDCALTLPPEKSSALAFETLFEEPMLLALPKDHPLAKQGSIQPRMLKDEVILSLNRSHRETKTIRDFFAASGVVVQDDYEGTSFDALRLMVSIGQGLSLFPQFYSHSECVADCGVVLRDIVGMTVERTIGLAWSAGSVRTHHYRKLLEECKAALNDHERDPVVLLEAA